MKQQFSFSRTIIAGVTATIVMTLFTYMGQFMNLKMDIPAMLGSIFGGNLLIGWIMHFMIGIILAFNYAIIFYSKIGINPILLRGAIFGIIPWLMAQIIVMPMMSMVNGMAYSAGLFSGSFMMAMASFVGHLIFGTVVGIIYRPEAKLATA
jgi:uncharacterized membrane protein YagU involved in acid resistance